jgi:hypothetical protein
LNAPLTRTCTLLALFLLVSTLPRLATAQQSAAGLQSLSGIHNRPKPGPASRVWPRGIAFAALLCCAWPLRRKHASLLWLPLALCAFALTGCGGSRSSPSLPVNPGTPAGAYAVTVAITGTAGSATLSHSAKLTLTVQ